MDKEKTKTVFRIYSDGDVVALFPQIAADNYGWLSSQLAKNIIAKSRGNIRWNK